MDPFYKFTANILSLLILSSVFILPLDSKTVKRNAGSCGDWCYEEEVDVDFECDIPVRWIDHDCITGDRQSPIDIPVDLIPSKYSEIVLSSQYALPSTFELANNGHSAAITPLNAKELIMTGSSLEGSYVAAGLHFHWGQNNTFGSEHKLNGNSFTMELHIVHHKTQYKDLDEALESDDSSSVAVLGVFFEIEKREEDPDNEALQSIIQLLSSVQEAGVHSEGVGLKISDLIPSNSEIFNYQGSLTTPCCNQNVFWTVFKTPLTVSTKQMSEFRNLKFHNGHHLQNNYRGPQPLNNRNIIQSYGSVHISSNPPSTPNSGGKNQKNVFLYYFISVILLINITL